jgi:hypothetical protein
MVSLTCRTSAWSSSMPAPSALRLRQQPLLYSGKGCTKTEAWKRFPASSLRGHHQGDQSTTRKVSGAASKPRGMDHRRLSTPRSPCDPATTHHRQGHGERRNPGSAPCRGGNRRPWQGRSQPARLSCGHRRRSFGKGQSPRMTPSVGSRPGRSDGEGTMPPQWP